MAAWGSIEEWVIAIQVGHGAPTESSAKHTTHDCITKSDPKCSPFRARLLQFAAAIFLVQQQERPNVHWCIARARHHHHCCVPVPSRVHKFWRLSQTHRPHTPPITPISPITPTTPTSCELTPLVREVLAVVSARVELRPGVVQRVLVAKLDHEGWVRVRVPVHVRGQPR